MRSAVSQGLTGFANALHLLEHASSHPYPAATAPVPFKSVKVFSRAIVISISLPLLSAPLLYDQFTQSVTQPVNDHRPRGALSSSSSSSSSSGGEGGCGDETTCVLYDNASLARITFAFACTGKAVSCVCFFVSWFLYRREAKGHYEAITPSLRTAEASSLAQSGADNGEEHA